MYKILSFIMFSFNILVSIRFAAKTFNASKIWKFFIFLLSLFSINTVSSIIGFYLAGSQMNRWFILGINFIILIAILFLFYICTSRCTVNPIIINNHPNLYIFFSVFFIIFLLLLISTNMEFLPIYGNVDDIHHFQINTLIFNELSVENPLPYKGNPLPLSYKGWNPLQEKFEIFSYLWGYHYNCALISYLFHIDILHVTHILRCLSAATVVSMPLLMIRSQSSWSIILYIFLSCFNYNSWYGFLTSGYSPNFFSLMICWTIISILCNTDRYVLSKLETRLILPLAAFLGLASYLATGILLLLFIIYYYYCKKALKSIGWIFIWCTLLLPQPAISSQIKLIFQKTENINPAIADHAWMSSQPSALWMVLASIGIIAMVYRWKSNHKQVRWEFLLFSVSIFVLFFYVFAGRSYAMHKFLLIETLLLTAFLCEYIVKVGKFSGNLCIRRILVYTLSGCIIFFLHQKHVFNLTLSPFPCNEVKAEITQAGLDCFDYILSLNMKENYYVEYLGTNGPGTMLGAVMLSKLPYSYTNSYHISGTYTAQKFVNTVLSRQCNGERIIVWLDNNGLPDKEILERYAFLFSDMKKLYQSENHEVLRLDTDSRWIIYPYDIDYLTQNHEVEYKKIPRYGESVIMKDKNKQTTISLNMESIQKISFIHIGGRVLSGSELIIRGVCDGNTVYEEKLEMFDGNYLFMPDNGIICDKIELLATAKTSDAIIINNIYMGGMSK